MSLWSSCLVLALVGMGCGASPSASRRDTCLQAFAKRALLHEDDTWQTDFCRGGESASEMQPGGQPRDGIPPIDAPAFVTIANANTWIRDTEPVVAFEHNGDVRAYPLQILIWHEVVNDEVGGLSVVVSFCPLCYAALVFERPAHEGERLTFGTTGVLRRSDLVMWDRQTESWWQQFDGEAIVGRLAGERLRALPTAIVSWKAFKAAHPTGTVLSRDTGAKRAYGRNPYVGYDDIEKKPYYYRGRVGDGLPPMARVVGVKMGAEARAYSMDTVRRKRRIHDMLAGNSIAVLWAPGAASAVQAETIAAGSDVGSVGVFLTKVRGQALTFQPEEGGGFIDVQTRSSWTVRGIAVRGPLAGERLTPVVHHQVFWFAWSAFVGERGRLHQP